MTLYQTYRHLISIEAMKQVTPCLLASVLALMISTPLYAQPASAEIDFEHYLALVQTNHSGISLAKYDVAIAKEKVKQSKALPDPELTFSAYDNQERRLKLGYGFETEISWELELGGKRRARQKMATEHLKLAELEYKEYHEEVQIQARVLFLEALQNRMQKSILSELLDGLIQIKNARSLRPEENTLIRHAHNDLRAQLDQTERDGTGILANFNELISNGAETTNLAPSGTLADFATRLPGASVTAEVSDSEASAAAQKLKVTEQQIQLARAERVMNLGVHLGVSNNAFVKNIIGPNPSHTTVHAGVTVPLQFSNRYETATAVALIEQQKAVIEYNTALRQQERENHSRKLVIEQTAGRYRKSSEEYDRKREELTNAHREYRAGQVSTAVLLDRIAAVQKAAAEYSDALLNYSKAAQNLTVAHHTSK